MKIMIFANQLEIVGGAEDYVIRKTTSLTKMGHEVYLVSPSISPFYKEIFTTNQIEHFEYKYFGTSPQYFNKNKKKEIIEGLEERFHTIKIDLIESHQVYPMLWAELVSEKLNIPNLVYILNESGNYPKYYKKFFVKKLTANEIIGCNSMTIPILNKKLKVLDYKNSYVNISIEVEELVDEEIDIKITNEFVITTIARLDKYYIKNLMNDIYKLSLLGSSPKILLIIIGEGLYEKEYKLFAEKIMGEKLNILFTGTIKPLSKNIFEKTDLFIGMGTTTILSASCACPTLVADPISNQSSGFLGVHTSNFAFLEPGRKIETFYYYILTLLESEELIERYSKAAKECYLNEFEHGKVTNKYLEYLQEVDINFKKDDYIFNEKIVYSNHLVERVRACLVRLLGFKSYNKLNNNIINLKAKVFKNSF